MTDDDSPVTKLQRLPTGVPGLDTILNGGFFRGGVYLIHAQPGSGKTILGNQICFAHVAGGGRAVFVTLLTESHSRLLAQLETLDFFDPNVVGSSLSYVTGYQALEKDKLPGLLALLRKVIRDQKATFLVIDGMVTAGTMADSAIETKKFIHELQVFAELFDCTTLLLTGTSEARDQYAFRTMVDGLIELHVDPIELETIRSLSVTKFRGGAMLLGRHLFDITDAGLIVFPRIESNRGRRIDRLEPRKGDGATFGIKGLDEMLEGGLSPASVTMIIGTSGVGKTLSGLSFLSGSTKKDPGLYVGFFETPSQLVAKAQAVGIPFGDQIKNKTVSVMWKPVHADYADALAETLLETLQKQGIRRLFLDGLTVFRTSLIYRDRSARFFGALFNELRSLGVVTVVADEIANFTASEFPRHDMASMLDNVIFLRNEARDGTLHKIITVAKTREAPSNSETRELSIDARGITAHAVVRKPVKKGKGKRRSR
jgi:circadian clock protein KaiC